MARLSDEEVAARILHIYFREVARLGYKRRLSLDEVINAYYYTISKLGGKKKAMASLIEKVKEEETELRTETKEELLPKVGQAKQVVETETVTEETEETNN